jgi:hypothetical protein
MIRHLIVSILILSSACHGLAQGSSGNKEKTPGLLLEIVYWGSWMDRPLKYRSGNELKAIPLQAGSVTAYTYSGPSPLILYREEAMDPATNELKPVPILSLPFKEGLRRAIVLITPKEEDKLVAQLVPLTADTFPPNSVYFTNLSGKVLRCKLYDKTWEMKTDEKKLLPVPGGNTKVGLLAAMEWKNSWQVLHTDTFRVGEGERRVIYFHTPAGSQGGVAAMSAVIPPDTVRYDSKGRPLESPAVDPSFKPGPRPTGIEGGWNGGPR